MTDALTKKLTVAEYLAFRNECLEIVGKIEQAKKRLVQIEGMVKHDYGYLMHDLEHSRFDTERAPKIVDKFFWSAVINKCELTNVMTEAFKKDYLEQLEKVPPEFSQNEIDGFVQNVENIYMKNIETTLKEVYEKLINTNYGDWRNRKQSNLRGVEQKFRCRGNINKSSWSNGFTYDYGSRYSLNYEDLYTCCKLIDGKGRNDYADRFYAIANEALKNNGDFIETRYFTIKCFKNGNQLVTWTNLDILALFNKLGSGEKTLPDVLNKRYKQEHFQDESF